MYNNTNPDDSERYLWSSFENVIVLMYIKLLNFRTIIIYNVLCIVLIHTFSYPVSGIQLHKKLTIL